jgi:hypothetical protein
MFNYACVTHLQAKTHYICGCVLSTLVTESKRKPEKSKILLHNIDRLKVDMMTAAKLRLPTRHVTLKSRGGLIFASKNFYELMCKVEDRFYSTVSCVRVCH